MRLQSLWMCTATCRHTICVPSWVLASCCLQSDALAMMMLTLLIMNLCPHHRGPINRGTNFKPEYGPETGLTAAHQILRHLYKDLAPISGTLQGRDQFPG